MGLKLSRKKSRSALVTFIYRGQKLLPFSSKFKFKLFLNLEWMFNRLSHEMSFKYYSPSTHPVRQCSKQFILDHLDENSNVLDLGCNQGDISNIIAEKVKRVVGIDYDKGAIDRAIKRYQRPNLEFQCGEASEYLQKSPERFDALILSHILEHLDDPKAFLNKFKGDFDSIYIELPDYEISYLNFYRRDLRLKLNYTDNDHITEFDRSDMRQLLDECGLEIIREEYRYGLIKIWCRNRVKPS